MMEDILFLVLAMEPRVRASPEQFSILLDYMERHGDLSRPQQGPQGRIKSERMWNELANTLNSLGGGVIKSPDKWKKMDLPSDSDTSRTSVRKRTSTGTFASHDEHISRWLEEENEDDFSDVDDEERILPPLDSFTELQTLTFQSKVINIITEIRFGEQYQATPLQSRGYQTGQHAQSPSPSSYRTDEFEATYSTNTTINNFTDDSQEEHYNFALLPNSNT
ncbi:uncharacterized protein LOC142980613 [Anticarsia gemmatalis]|uniref:uncharacterized protein LOC142980613 n=1 Tax=Anticarsia gemmatalis TaxID=129554 RepID=UPI003F7780F6